MGICTKKWEFLEHWFFKPYSLAPPSGKMFEKCSKDVRKRWVSIAPKSCACGTYADQSLRRRPSLISSNRERRARMKNFVFDPGLLKTISGALRRASSPIALTFLNRH